MLKLQFRKNTERKMEGLTLKHSLILILFLMSNLSFAQTEQISEFNIDIYGSLDTTLIVGKDAEEIVISTNKKKDVGFITFSPDKMSLSGKTDTYVQQSDTFFTISNFLSSINLDYNNNVEGNPILKKIKFESVLDGYSKGQDQNTDVNDENSAELISARNIIKVKEDEINKLSRLSKILGFISLLLLSVLIFIKRKFMLNIISKLLKKMKKGNNPLPDSTTNGDKKVVGQQDEEGKNDSPVGFEFFNTLCEKYNKHTDGNLEQYYKNMDHVLEFIDIPRIATKKDKETHDSIISILSKYSVSLNLEDLTKKGDSEKKEDKSILKLTNYDGKDNLLEILKSINPVAHEEIETKIRGFVHYFDLIQKIRLGRNKNEDLDSVVKLYNEFQYLKTIEDLNSFLDEHLEGDLSESYKSQIKETIALSKKINTFKETISSKDDLHSKLDIMDKFNSEIFKSQKDIIQMRKSQEKEIRKIKDKIINKFSKVKEIQKDVSTKEVFDFLWKKVENVNIKENENKFLEASSKYFGNLKDKIDLKIQKNDTIEARSLMSKYVIELAFHFKDYLKRINLDSTTEFDNSLKNQKLMITSPGDIKGLDPGNYDQFTYNPSKFTNFIMNFEVLIKNMKPTDLEGVLIDGTYFK